jgi:hypothetical protein
MLNYRRVAQTEQQGLMGSNDILMPMKLNELPTKKTISSGNNMMYRIHGFKFRATKTIVEPSKYVACPCLSHMLDD